MSDRDFVVDGGKMMSSAALQSGERGRTTACFLYVLINGSSPVEASAGLPPPSVPVVHSLKESLPIKGVGVCR